MNQQGSSPQTAPEQRFGSARISIDGKALNGFCPSCGYPRDLAAFEVCDFCRQVRDDEENHDLPLVRMAKAGLRRGAERRWE